MKQAWHALRLPLGAIGLALLIGAILLALSGANPVGAYGALLQGAFGGVDEFGRTLEKSTPLIFSGLAVAFAFKAGLFNIGGQGQLLIGALVAGVIGFAVPGLPPILHLPLAFIGGALAGGLYGMIPGALKAYTGAHEVITTIMLNYIAIKRDLTLDDETSNKLARRLWVRAEQVKNGRAKKEQMYDFYKDD